MKMNIKRGLRKSACAARFYRPDRDWLLSVYRRLLDRYGAQHWWPGESTFEIMVGAVLTQNTSWANVERAIGNLASRQLLDPLKILDCDADQLAALLRPCGYFNVKTRRLGNLCRFLVTSGGHDRLSARDTVELRRALLSVHGIGPETADDILLYAFERPVFVIDAYTRRVFERLGMASGEASYEVLREGIEWALGPEPQLYNEYHALIVRHAKEVCKARPRCGDCCLSGRCPAAKV